ncbi:MAG: hypothetical protein ACR2QM_13855 [Longimicrobiales bacterium]
MILRLTASLLLAAILFVVPSDAAFAQQRGLGFRFLVGAQGIGGDYGDILDTGLPGEFTVLYGLDKIRLGGGFGWTSHGMNHGAEEGHFSFIDTHFLVGYPFTLGSSGIRPYVEGRFIYRKIRPEDGLFGHEPEPSEDRGEFGEHEFAFSVSGTGGEAVVGAEIPVTRRLRLDVSGRVGRFTSTAVDLQEFGLDTYGSGSSWGVYFGAFWFP